MPVLLLREGDIRGLIGPEAALREVRAAFVQLGRGEATLPGVIGLEIPRPQAAAAAAGPHGEVHVKGAYLHGAPFFVIKEASGFYDNPAAHGLPVGGGLMLVFGAATGFLRAILFDNGYLTELRTGAAGALAADLLARRSLAQVGIIGSGSQARYQLEALLCVRRPERVVVWGRSPERAAACAREMAARHGVAATAVDTARQAVSGSDLVVTVTPARQPIVRGDWLAPGTHVTAVGSDGPDKQELDIGVLGRADRVVADRLEQCLRLGEIHHAVEAGVLRAEAVQDLGALAAGLAPGRTRDDEITVADLTGVGVQDAAVAGFVTAEALRLGIGNAIDV